MKTEKIVSIISWIPLQLVASFLSGLIGGQLETILKPKGLLLDTLNSIGGFNYMFATSAMSIVAIIVVTIVGLIIICRYDYGCKRFWIIVGICYTVYWALTIGVLIYEGINWRILGQYYFIGFAVYIILYPAIALLGLMLVMTITRWAKTLIHKNDNH